jgi:hypothetical protein
MVSWLFVLVLVDTGLSHLGLVRLPPRSRMHSSDQPIYYYLMLPPVYDFPPLVLVSPYKWHGFVAIQFVLSPSQRWRSPR